MNISSRSKYSQLYKTYICGNFSILNRVREGSESIFIIFHMTQNPTWSIFLVLIIVFIHLMLSETLSRSKFIWNFPQTTRLKKSEENEINISTSNLWKIWWFDKGCCLETEDCCSIPSDYCCLIKYINGCSTDCRNCYSLETDSQLQHQNIISFKTNRSDKQYIIDLRDLCTEKVTFSSGTESTNSLNEFIR